MNNINTSNRALFGSRTEQNLKTAFEHEASSAVREDIYSRQARDEKDTATRRMLDEMFENSSQLGELWLSYLDETADTSDNLSDLSHSKSTNLGEMYDEMAKVAEEEGFHEIAEKFRMAALSGKQHAELLSQRAEHLKGEKIYYDNADTPHRCPVCGYTVMGNTHPDICPLCVMEWF